MWHPFLAKWIHPFLVGLHRNFFSTMSILIHHFPRIAAIPRFRLVPSLFEISVDIRRGRLSIYLYKYGLALQAWQSGTCFDNAECRQISSFKLGGSIELLVGETGLVRTIYQSKCLVISFY